MIAWQHGITGLFLHRQGIFSLSSTIIRRPAMRLMKQSITTSAPWRMAQEPMHSGNGAPEPNNAGSVNDRLDAMLSVEKSEAIRDLIDEMIRAPDGLGVNVDEETRALDEMERRSWEKLSDALADEMEQLGSPLSEKHHQILENDSKALAEAEQEVEQNQARLARERTRLEEDMVQLRERLSEAEDAKFSDLRGRTSERYRGSFLLLGSFLATAGAFYYAVDGIVSDGLASADLGPAVLDAIIAVILMTFYERAKKRKVREQSDRRDFENK